MRTARTPLLCHVFSVSGNLWCGSQATTLRPCTGLYGLGCHEDKHCRCRMLMAGRRRDLIGVIVSRFAELALACTEWQCFTWAWASSSIQRHSYELFVASCGYSRVKQSIVTLPTRHYANGIAMLNNICVGLVTGRRHCSLACTGLKIQRYHAKRKNAL